MRNSKTYIALFIAVLALALGGLMQRAEAARQANEFSTDYNTFVEQMAELFDKTTDKKDAKEFINQLTRFMKSGDTKLRDNLIAECNRLRKLKARPYPDYKDCVLTFIQLENNQWLTGGNRETWLSILESRSEGRGSSLNKVRDWLHFATNLMTDGAIHTTSAIRWKVTDPEAISIIRTKNDVAIYVEQTTLRCLSQGDSIEVQNTSGMMKGNQWEGTEGTITWERVGLDPDKVYATFDKYKIDFRSNVISVDSCMFCNKNYFEDEMPGRLTYKCTSRRTQQGNSYPKFEMSEYEYIKIENIFENVNYFGGFTQTGANFVGSGTEINPAIVTFVRKDKDAVSIKATSYTISHNQIESGKAEVEIKVMDGTIRHPGVLFRYNNGTRTLELTRGNKGMEQTIYKNTYHKMNMDVELMTWNIDSDHINLTMLYGAAEKIVYFESDAYYHDNYYAELGGMNTVHPFQMIADYTRVNGGRGFTAKELADFYQMTKTDAEHLLLNLSYKGFINYFSQQQLWIVDKRLYDYLDYKRGAEDMDYDVIRFISRDTTGVKSTSNVNGYIDLLSGDIMLNYVPGVVVSETSNVNLVPKDGKIILKKNRDFEFDGRVIVGDVDITGKDFYFSYDQFNLRLDSIERMEMWETVDSIFDRYGHPIKKRVPNTLNDFSGLIQIDRPNNKSGKDKEASKAYPRLNTSSPGHIYYDSNKIQDGKYTKDKFYFAVDTFTFENITEISNKNLPFNGVLTSNIFPDIRHELSIREDGSLGFVVQAPDEGYPIYGGKAKFYDMVDLSNAGLRGHGEMEYLTSRSRSKDYFLFLLDHAEGTTRDFFVTKTTTGVTYPGVELGFNQATRDENNFQVPGQTWLQFYPEEDHLDVRNTKGKFQMYPTTKRESGFECEMSGKLSVTPKGLKGRGMVTIDRTELEANIYDFTDHTLLGDTSYMVAYAINEQQQWERSTGQTRKEIIDESNKRIYTAVSSEIRRKMLNDAITADTIVDRVCRREPSIYKKLMARSLTSFVDFDKRDAKFEFKSGGGNKMDFDKVQYRTNVQNFTWDIDRNAMIIGQKGSVGNRFVCTKERGDSLNFLVPIAVFDSNKNILRCEDVEYIVVADTKVNLNKGTVVTIHPKAVMEPLTKTKLETRTDSTNHVFYNANINILGAKEYNGHGEYIFVDKEMGRHSIFMSDIHTEDATTHARGTTPNDMPFDKYFEFRGDAIVWAPRQNLEFDGGVKMRHRAPHGPKGYVRFDAVIDVNKVRIPIEERSFGTTSGKSRDKSDEIYKAIYITRDSTHIYSSMLERRKDVNDMKMFEAPVGVLYHNNIFDRFEIIPPEKILKPDTTGAVMAFTPSEDAISGFGLIDYHQTLSKKAPTNFVMKSAGDIRHDRKNNVVKTNTLSHIDFFMHPKIATFIYNDITKSNATKCDTTSFRYENRMREMYDTTMINQIRMLSRAGLDIKTGLLPDDGSPLFTIDNLAMTWSTAKSAYVCDTTVNLMMMKFRKVYKKVQLQAEFYTKKNIGTRIRMLMKFDGDKWYYFDFKTKTSNKYYRMSVLSSNPEFFNEVEGISIGDRRNRARNTEIVMAPESYLTSFKEGFGLNNIVADPFADDVKSDESEGENEATDIEGTPDENEDEEEENEDENNDENANDSPAETPAETPAEASETPKPEEENSLEGNAE